MRAVIYKAMLAAPFRLTGAGIGLAGFVGSVWPEKIKSVIGDGLPIQGIGIVLLIAAVLYFFFLWLLKPGERPGDAASHQTTHGLQSHNIGQAEVVNIHHHATRAAVQPRRQAQDHGFRGRQRGSDVMNEQLARIARAAEGYPAGLATYRDGPAKPDFPLKEVTNRVIAQMGPYPDGDADRQGYFRRLNLEIADKIRLDDLTIWARYADFPVKHIDQADLEHVIVNVVKDVISIPNDWNTLVYTDVQFVKVEVDRVWPKPLETTNDASP